MGLERYEKRSIDMKIRDILKDNSPHVSFEVFPPKTDAGYEGVRAATEKIAALRPLHKRDLWSGRRHQQKYG